MNKSAKRVADNDDFKQFVLSILMLFSLFLSFASVTNIVHEIGVTPSSLDMLTPATMKDPNDCTLRRMVRMGSDVAMSVCYNPTKAEQLRYTMEKDHQQEKYLRPLTVVANICLGLWLIAGIVIFVIRFKRLQIQASR